MKMRCCRRSSSGVGMDLNLDSITVSRAAEAGVNPRMDWAVALASSRSGIAAERSMRGLYRRAGCIPEMSS